MSRHSLDASRANPDVVRVISEQGIISAVFSIHILKSSSFLENQILSKLLQSLPPLSSSALDTLVFQIYVHGID